MAGNLGFEELIAAVRSGAIDTVLVAMIDMASSGQRRRSKMQRRMTSQLRQLGTSCDTGYGFCNQSRRKLKLRLTR